MSATRGTILGGPRRPGRPDGTRATSSKLGTTQGQSENRSEYSTVLTKRGVQSIYDGSRIWVKITLELETAGPVAIGTKKDISPVLSGKGMLLDQGKPQEFIIGQSNVLWVAASNVNRIKMKLEPIPWLEQIAGVLAKIGNH